MNQKKIKTNIDRLLYGLNLDKNNIWQKDNNKNNKNKKSAVIINNI